MKTLHRTVVVGAFGGLAAAAAAGSMAFACSPIDGLRVTDLAGRPMSPVIAQPGDTVNLSVTNFRPAGTEVKKLSGETVVSGPVEISWFRSQVAASGRLILNDNRGGFNVTISIPDDISTDPNLQSQIVARQFDTAGNPLATDSKPVYLRSAVPAGRPDVKPVPATTPALPDATPAVQPTQAAPKAPAVGAIRQAPVAARAEAAPAAPIAPVTPSAVAAQPALTAAPAPAVSPLLVPEPAGQQAPSDLWTGLSSERLPSLLDSPQATANSGVPMGAILFGTGMLTLAGAALALGGRRLAVVRRITSRR